MSGPVPVASSADLTQYAGQTQDQGQCGSCTAYGTDKVLEANNYIVYGLYVKLSERDLFACGASPGGCFEGSYMEPILDRTLVGVATLTCCPDGNMPQGVSPSCGDNRCQDWALTGWKSASWRQITFDQARVLMSDPNQPETVVITMAVYASFESYRSGVYHHLPGDSLLGYHCIALVGFDNSKDNSNGAITIWNSWGNSWGYGNQYTSGGLCDISYSEIDYCQIVFYQLVPGGPITPSYYTLPAPQPSPQPSPPPPSVQDMNFGLMDPDAGPSQPIWTDLILLYQDWDWKIKMSGAFAA